MYVCLFATNKLGSELTMGQWVMGQMGQQIGWVTGQYPWPVDPFYIVLIRYPTWFSGPGKRSNVKRNCYFNCLL